MDLNSQPVYTCFIGAENLDYKRVFILNILTEHGRKSNLLGSCRKHGKLPVFFMYGHR